RRDAAAVAVVRRRPVLPGGASQLLRKVLARPRHQQPGVWLPIRRRRWLLVVHLARRSAVPTRRGGVVTMRTNKLRKILAVLSVVAVSVISAVLVHEAHAAGTLISQGKPVTASSVENAGTPASAAVDGDTGTRWSSAFGDPQWIQVDLGAIATSAQGVLVWAAAYATAIQTQTSANGSSWPSVHSTTTGTGRPQTSAPSGTGGYVRMHGTARATPWGYSLWEFQVFGTLASGCGTENAAHGRPATASSVESAAFPASAAVDGNPGTRWSSAFSDPQWIRVDLGASAQICRVVLSWEAAYATAFQIQTSS